MINSTSYIILTRELSVLPASIVTSDHHLCVCVCVSVSVCQQDNLRSYERVDECRTNFVGIGKE